MQQKVQAEVLAASQSWIIAFNQGDLHTLVNAYTKDAPMHPRPNLICIGLQDIEEFWSHLLSTGAGKLVYSNIRLEVVGDNRVRLSAHWTMNIAAGVITNELWVKQETGQWQIQQDDFEVAGPGCIADFVSLFHANLTGWFSGSSDAVTTWAWLDYACPDNLVLVYPSGTTLTGAEFLQSIRNHPRDNEQFLAVVEQINVLSESASEGVVSYVEVQSGAANSSLENRRAALGLVHKGPHGWRWRHIQETALD